MLITAKNSHQSYDLLFAAFGIFLEGGHALIYSRKVIRGCVLVNGLSMHLVKYRVDVFNISPESSKSLSMISEGNEYLCMISLGVPISQNVCIKHNVAKMVVT